LCHQISFTELISGQVRSVRDQFLGFKILFDYVSVTTTIEIKMVNNELIFNTIQATTYGTTELGGSGFIECNSKTITRSNSGLSMSDIANRAANYIGNQLKVNPEYNLFNGNIKTALVDNFGTTFKGVKWLADKAKPDLSSRYPIIGKISNGLFIYDWTQKGVNFWRYYRDNTGHSAYYNVMSNGTLQLLGTNFKF
jgi:hypothetical protein